jgi:hypothetical protein
MNTGRMHGTEKPEVFPILLFAELLLAVSRDFGGFRNSALILPILSWSCAAKMAVARQRY